MKAILLTLILILAKMTTHAQSTADDVAIRENVQTLVDGWTKKDGTLFAKPFAENADYVVINGMHIKGKMAIANSHQAIFNSFYKETFIKADIQSIRYLRPDIAIAHIGSQMTGTSNGKNVDTKARISMTFEKTANGWQIAAFHNTQIVEQPAPVRTGN